MSQTNSDLRKRQVLIVWQLLTYLHVDRWHQMVSECVVYLFPSFLEFGRF